MVKKTFLALVKKFWDEAVVYASALVGVWYSLLQLATISGGKFHPSTEAVIGAIVISTAVTWLIDNRGIAIFKKSPDVAAALAGRRKNVIPRALGAWFCGAVGQVALPQLLDAGVKMVVGFFSAFGGQG